MTDAPYTNDAARDAYPAPPAWRPLSAMAVLSLVLAILLGIVALFGLWWVEALPLLLGVLAIGATGAGGKRGRGIAIAGVVIALLAGGGCFAMHRGIERALEDHFAGLVDALDRGDKEQAARFAADPAKAEAWVPRWIERAQALRAKQGKYGGELSIGNLFLGIGAAFAPPEGIEELEPRGEGLLGIGDAMWARAKYEKGEAWVAFVVRDPDKAPEETVEELKHLEKGGTMRWVRDVRVYLRRDASSK